MDNINRNQSRQTCVKQASMGKSKNGCLKVLAFIQVDFHFFAFNGIWNNGILRQALA